MDQAWQETQRQARRTEEEFNPAAIEISEIWDNAAPLWKEIESLHQGSFDEIDLMIYDILEHPLQSPPFASNKGGEFILAMVIQTHAARAEKSRELSDEIVLALDDD